ncbi:hypothetical protein IFM89_007790 [Coptis chinensis]|uniref:Peptidyl-prolyl cis-trans isomerase n=1 Tax=Coptis chinensis TaxID=261450 RepID=A0A835IXL2_9MAGN|nr:hypothetical protein IFM89_007790 [Coptis chinensis]
MSVMIETSLGSIVIDLEPKLCPITTKNFLKLCKIKYYNGCLFHTVQNNFIAQTGDPTGTGKGGDSIYKFLYGDQARFFGDEIRPELKHSKKGTVAMASAGENLNASQFYFTLRDDLDYLDEKHTVFGKVEEGFDTLERINEAYVDEKERPYKNIRSFSFSSVHFDGLPYEQFIVFHLFIVFHHCSTQIDDDVRLEDDWVPMDEQMGPAELEEVMREKEAHSSAVVLESIGDIPEAEVKPPENVLFVCKLNPVTEDEDLNTIFSRFGSVVSADIIRDFKTGDSLCYAFVEFETVEACEQAYFKMDNALIDDRRIHVDFSQSVSKLWSQFRRKENQMGKGKPYILLGLLNENLHNVWQLFTSVAVFSFLSTSEIVYINKKRYDMVFDPLSSAEGKSHHESDRKMNRQSTEGLKQRDREKRDNIGDKYRDGEKRRGYRDDVRNHESRRSSGGRKDEEYHGDRAVKDKESHNKHHAHGDRRDKPSYEKSDTQRDRRDVLDYRKVERGDRRDDRDQRHEHGSRKRSRHSEHDHSERSYREEKRR